jgi:hypothetical protein
LPQNFKCYKSGVYNMGPCKRENPVPLALSYPHFYQVQLFPSPNSVEANF